MVNRSSTGLTLLFWANRNETGERPGFTTVTGLRQGDHECVIEREGRHPSCETMSKLSNSANSHRMGAVPRAEIAPVVALGGLALGAMGLIALADALRGPGASSFDLAVLQALRVPGYPHDPVGPGWLEEATMDLTSLGGLSVLGLFAVIAIGFLIIQRKHLSAVVLAVGLMGGVTLSEGLKALFDRPRPPVAYQVVETLNASFPSGHALLSTVFYLSVGVMMARAFGQRRLRTYVMTVAISLALIIGLTRIYLGAHWVTDVLAGWSIGAAWAVVLWFVSRMIGYHQARHPGGPHDLDPDPDPIPKEG